MSDEENQPVIPPLPAPVPNALPHFQNYGTPDFLNQDVQPEQPTETPESDDTGVTDLNSEEEAK
jgi:hypothetical protein